MIQGCVITNSRADGLPVHLICFGIDAILSSCMLFQYEWHCEGCGVVVLPGLCCCATGCHLTHGGGVWMYCSREGCGEHNTTQCNTSNQINQSINQVRTKK